MNPSVILILVALASALAAAVWAVIERGRSVRAEAELAGARAQIAASKLNDETVKAHAALAAEAAAETLVKRASEAFETQNRLSQANLAAQLKPVAETLEKFEKKVNESDAARAREAGGVKVQIDQLMAATIATQAEAQRLSGALRRGAGVQGQWGEQILRNVLELAGMREGLDFEEQAVVRAAEGIQRPDVVVFLPRKGRFVIDSKCSTTAYLEAQQASDEAVREAAYARHASSVKGHIQALSAKAYWETFQSAPDFVVMFVPGDGILAAAVERQPELYTLAAEKRVILTTPSSLFALCMAVMYGWRVERQNENAREIADLGRELYKRLSVMGGHVGALGKALTGAVEGYNRFVGSLESQVLTQAKRFEQLKADNAATPIRDVKAVDAPIRTLGKLAAEPPAPALTAEGAAPTSAP